MTTQPVHYLAYDGKVACHQLAPDANVTNDWSAVTCRMCWQWVARLDVARAVLARDPAAEQADNDTDCGMLTAAGLTAEQEIRSRALAAAVAFYGGGVNKHEPSWDALDAEAAVVLAVADLFAAWFTDGAPRTPGSGSSLPRGFLPAAGTEVSP